MTQTWLSMKFLGMTKKLWEMSMILRSSWKLFFIVLAKGNNFKTTSFILILEHIISTNLQTKQTLSICNDTHFHLCSIQIPNWVVNFCRGRMHQISGTPGRRCPQFGGDGRNLCGSQSFGATWTILGASTSTKMCGCVTVHFAHDSPLPYQFVPQDWSYALQPKFAISWPVCGSIVTPYSLQWDPN
jgi:hypothetical protein